MPLLHAQEKMIRVSSMPHFTLNETRLEEFKAQTDAEFDRSFLNHKDVGLPSVVLQTYYLDRDSATDDVTSLLGSKLLVRPGHLHEILLREVRGQEWLPQQHDDMAIVLFMRDKKKMVRQLEIISWADENSWTIESVYTLNLRAGTFIIAEGNAL